MTRVRTLVATEALLVFGLLVFVGAAYFIELLGFDEPISLSPLGALALSAVPAGLWLAYFHAQDRHEPEPKHFVLGVYLLGAFVAGPLAGFLADHVISPPALVAPPFGDWSIQHLVEAILLIGLAQEASKYLVLRYTIYLSDEFDEPMDGIIYATAVGIGFATYQNFHDLQGGQGSVFLATGATNAVVTTLAHACFAAVTGYVLGRARFVNTSFSRHTITLIIGLLIAAGLNGNFQLLESKVTQSGVGLEPWRAVAFAAIFAAVVFAAIFVLMRRLLRISPHRQD